MNSLLVGLALSVGAPTLKEKEKPPSLVGEWVIEQFTVGGNPGAPDGHPNRWVFRADGTRAVIDPHGKTLADGNFTTDPKAGTLDLVSNVPATEQYLCRYRLDGDTLTLNVGWPKADRPAALASPANSHCTLYVMKRVKPKD